MAPKKRPAKAAGKRSKKDLDNLRESLEQAKEAKQAVLKGTARTGRNTENKKKPVPAKKMVRQELEKVNLEGLNFDFAALKEAKLNYVRDLRTIEDALHADYEKIIYNLEPKYAKAFQDYRPQYYRPVVKPEQLENILVNFEIPKTDNQADNILPPIENYALKTTRDVVPTVTQNNTCNDPNLFVNEPNRLFFYSPAVDEVNPPQRNYDQPTAEGMQRTTPQAANLISSMIEPGHHAPVIDFDIPIRVYPSSTPGNSHLYIDKPITWTSYKRILEALVEAKLVEPGWVRAAFNVGHSTVRPPWVKKGELPYAARVNLLTQTDEDLLPDIDSDEQSDLRSQLERINELYVTAKNVINDERYENDKLKAIINNLEYTIQDLQNQIEYYQNNAAATDAAMGWS